MQNKIRIKVGEVEVEYEGEQHFIENKLLDFVEEVFGKFSEKIKIIPKGEVVDDNGEGLLLTTASIAAKMKSKTGPDLVMAACAKLLLVQGNKDFSRQQILKEMQSAKSYFKKTYGNNVTRSLKGLVAKGELNELKENQYALSSHSEKIIRELLEAG